MALRPVLECGILISGIETSLKRPTLFTIPFVLGSAVVSDVPASLRDYPQNDFTKLSAQTSS